MGLYRGSNFFDPLRGLGLQSQDNGNHSVALDGGEGAAQAPKLLKGG